MEREATENDIPTYIPPELGAASTQTYLWIGNSYFYYNNGLPLHVKHLAQNDPKGCLAHSSTLVAISGAGLSWHDVASYFRPNAVGSHSADDDNNIVFNTLPNKYEVAILMDCSQCPIHPLLAPLFAKYARLHAQTVRAHGAVPVLFMSWGHANYPGMTAALARAYTEAGDENGMLVIPAGLAFERALANRATLRLHAEDNSHPTLAGTYLAAATAYSTLYRRSPVGNPYTAGLDADLARFLQTQAWDSTQGYRGTQAT